jgi:hypothetical protein
MAGTAIVVATAAKPGCALAILVTGKAAAPAQTPHATEQ